MASAHHPVTPTSTWFHLITDEIEQQLPQIKRLNVGLLHLFVQHTSASLTINENADPTVRQDMEAHFNHAAPEGAPYYRHIDEGDDGYARAHQVFTTWM